MSTKKTILISVSIIFGCALVILLIFSTEPEAKKETARKTSAMLVDVAQVERATYNPTVVATGNVTASKDISLSPRVSGEILQISENFTPGANVNKGEVLVQIDPADYRNTVLLRESDLQQAEADLKVEMGRQDVAKKDYELIGSELSTDNKDLVLRKPQLQQAKANVEAARAALNQAKLSLQRTTIRAPFDAHIVSRNANVGSQVNIGDVLGRLVGVDEYWVISNVPVAKVNWLSFEEGTGANGKGAEVIIKNDQIWPSAYQREGRLFRLVGALDNQTRLARVIVSVPDPMAQQTDNDSIPPLMIGTFVETHIQAKPLNNVVRLNLDYMRKNNTTWVMNDGKLEIRELDILFKDADYAYVSKGLETGDQVVTTNLATVVEGSPLRLENEQAMNKKTEEQE